MMWYIFTATFIVAWLPYAILSLWTMFNDEASVSMLIATLAPLLAKSSTIWNPMIYVVKNEEFRTALISTVAHTFSGNRDSRQVHV